MPGAVASETWSASLMAISGGRLIKYSPATGAVTVNVSIAPLTGTGGTYYMNQHVLAIQTLGNATHPIYRLINWTTAGTTTNFTARIISNTTYARRSLMETDYADDIPAGSYRFNTALLVDFNAGIGVTVGGMGYDVKPENPTKVYEQMRIQAYRLKTGETLWDIIVDEPLYSRSCYVADQGKIAVLTQNGYWLAYDLYSAKLAWKSERMDYPWGSNAFGAYAVQSAYGMLFRQGYDGVYAFNWTNGKIVWKYKAPALSPYETPYIDETGQTVYSFNAGGFIADGKMYVYNTEHTPSWPITRGWGLHCINITTGELVWKIANPMVQGAVADGYLVAANSWDGHMYVFGKGKSKTTVTAPDTVVPKGTGIVIRGTVLDMSPAQAGTPCVSKDSMSLQMEYLHLQRPIGGIWGNETITGVPVSLCAIDLKGNVIDIGTVTTNGYYGTFGMAWTPPEEGTYEIIASFAGDDSYGSSAASTFITVGPAPEPYPQPIQPQPPPQDNTPLIIATVAIIIAVATATLLILRKRP